MNKRLPGRFIFRTIAASVFAFNLNAQTVTQTTSGSYTYNVPAGVTTIIVECIGGGGGGGYISGGTGGAGGGGGGGAYVKSVINVTPSTSYTYRVGAGGPGGTGTNGGEDSWFGSVTTVMAKGGNGVANNTAGGATGGSASASYGDIRYSGGNGGNGSSATNVDAGGGGGGAGQSGNGGNGITPTGGTGNSPGGNGGAGRLVSENYGNGKNGNVSGGGGGGGRAGSSIWNYSYNGGNGASGMVRITIPPGPIATLLNYSASPSLTTSFAHRRGASSMPKFTLSSTQSFNAVQIELNYLSDFTGTALVSTIIDGNSYNSGTPYDFWTTEALTGDRTYFVRVRLSENGGNTWGMWTNQLWPYSYYPATPYPKEGWYYTAQEQFQTGIVNETLYNFISIQNNGTPYPDDDFFRLNQGHFNLTVSDNGDQYLTENTTNFSGASSDYLTIGSYYQFSAQRGFNGYRFTNFPVPSGVSVLTSNLKVYSHHRNNEPIPNNTNPLYLELVGVDQTNVNAWGNSSNTSTGGPRWRVRKSITIPWNITDSWTDLALMTSPDISPIIGEIVSTSGYSAGNTIALIADYTGGSHSSASRHRYFTTGRRNVAYRPSIEGTFTNFYNTVRFPNVDRAIYGTTVGWDELRITDNTVDCGSCYTEYRIHDAGSNAVLAGPFIRNAGMSGSQYFNISSVNAQHIYVSARIYRNNTPTIQDIWLTVTEPFPLPIELGEFDGKCENGLVHLKWNTVTELNSDSFTIESSTDGVLWSVEETVNAAGNSKTPVDYALSVRSRSENNYYRLKWTDFDGKSKYSHIIHVPCSKQAEISIYPNPNNGSFLISGADNGDAYQIYNAQGKQLSEGEITSSSMLIHLEEAASGTYVVRIINKGMAVHLKILVH